MEKWSGKQRIVTPDAADYDIWEVCANFYASNMDTYHT